MSFFLVFKKSSNSVIISSVEEKLFERTKYTYLLPYTKYFFLQSQKQNDNIPFHIKINEGLRELWLIKYFPFFFSHLILTLSALGSELILILGLFKMTVSNDIRKTLTFPPNFEYL